MKQSDFFKDIKPLTKYTHVSAQFSDSFSTPLKSYKPTKQNHSTGLWVFVVIAGLVLFWTVSLSLSRAKVTVSPKITTIPINETILLSKDTTKGSPIVFETVTLEGSVNDTRTFTQKVEKKEKAKGTITLYNSYKATPQKLVQNTRLINSQGNIYTLDKTITIPGYTTIDKKRVPGTVMTTITATAVGELYNVSSDTFKIVAMKATPAYDMLYAKNTQPITGGLDGTYFISDTPATQIEDSLKKRLNELVQKQIPDNYTFIKGLSHIAIDGDSSYFSKTEKVDVPVNGTIEQIVLETKSLEAYLSTKYPALKDAENLDLTLLTGHTLEKNNTAETVSYTVEVVGDIKREARIDDTVLKEKLVGISKSDFGKVMESFVDTVSTAELSIQPFWISKIPKTFNRINIIHTNGSL